MKNKDKSSLIYVSTIIVVIIVYLVIYLFGMAVRRDIYENNEGYQNNPSVQPINNIISNYIENIPLIFEYVNDEGNYIDLTNQFPTSDEDGKNFVGDKYTQDFKLRFNELATGIRYTITAEKLEESDLDNTWIKTYLTADNVGVMNCFRLDGKVKTMDEYVNYKNNPNEKILYQDRVSYAEARRGYKDFTFRMWISEDVKVVNEEYPTKTVKVKINVYAERII